MKKRDYTKIDPGLWWFIGGWSAFIISIALIIYWTSLS